MIPCDLLSSFVKKKRKKENPYKSIHYSFKARKCLLIKVKQKILSKENLYDKFFVQSNAIPRQHMHSRRMINSDHRSLSPLWTYNFKMSNAQECILLFLFACFLFVCFVLFVFCSGINLPLVVAQNTYDMTIPKVCLLPSLPDG